MRGEAMKKNEETISVRLNGSRTIKITGSKLAVRDLVGVITRGVANAHLANAEPDLLIALESLMDCINADGAIYTPKGSASMVRARAAIAKAKGEPNEA